MKVVAAWVNWILSQKVTIPPSTWISQRPSELLVVKNLLEDFQDGALINELAVRLLQNIVPDFVPTTYKPRPQSDKFRIANYEKAFEMFNQYAGLDLWSIDPKTLVTTPTNELVLNLLERLITKFQIGDTSCK